MSFWTKVGVAITDLECLKQSCRQHGITYEENLDENWRMQNNPVHATLRDTNSGEMWYLVRSEGAYKIMADQDEYYSSMTKRLGKNGGVVGRDYTANVITKGVTRNGGVVNLHEVQPDGSVLMKISTL